jgi:hypothetical protein
MPIKLKDIKDYIKDDEFRFTVFSDRIHIINYDEIISLENSRVSVVSDNMRIIIKGKNLLLNKLLDKEVLISGEILTIEVGHNEK